MDKILEETGVELDYTIGRQKIGVISVITGARKQPITEEEKRLKKLQLQYDNGEINEEYMNQEDIKNSSNVNRNLIFSISYEELVNSILDFPDDVAKCKYLLKLYSSTQDNLFLGFTEYIKDDFYKMKLREGYGMQNFSVLVPDFINKGNEYKEIITKIEEIRKKSILECYNWWKLKYSGFSVKIITENNEMYSYNFYECIPQELKDKNTNYIVKNKILTSKDYKKILTLPLRLDVE